MLRLRVVLAFVVLCGAMVSCAGSDEPASVAHKLNFVFVVVDDLDLTSTPYWEAMPKTKALIADRGSTFRNMFATDPVCCPAAGDAPDRDVPAQHRGVQQRGRPREVQNREVQVVHRRAAAEGRLHDRVHGQVPQRLRARPLLRAAGLGRVVRPRREEVPQRVRLRREPQRSHGALRGPVTRLPDRRAPPARHRVRRRAGRQRQAVPVDPLPDGPALADRAGPPTP